MTKRIGLTGNIGSGKSTVAGMLMERGAGVIDADALAREATQDPEVLARVAAELGSDLIRDGKLDRSATGARVFDDEAARSTLNAIVHPWVRRESERRASELAAGDAPPPLIVFDTPLLFESGLEEGLDAVVVVAAPLEVRVARVVERSGLSREEVEARDAAQMPLERKVALADVVIDNGSDRDALAQQVDACWRALVGGAA